MAPVAIFRFSPTEGPAYFAEWLSSRGIGFEVITLDGGAAVPGDPRAFAGIGMMGGPMSVNDDLPWIEPLCRLLRDAVDARVPIIGHCLGGQLLARALGAPVTTAREPEIGWSEVQTEGDGPAWFGGRSGFTTFQWHYETFALPPGGVGVLTNPAVPNQAYVIDDRHVGLQCHVEMTDALVETWLAAGAHELPAATRGRVQSAATIRENLAARVTALHAVAGDLYTRWARGLRDATAG
ncbi:MAG: type 1 glutamine amidotransferase [Casimicrobiaceae bacterium]